MPCMASTPAVWPLARASLTQSPPQTLPSPQASVKSGVRTFFWNSSCMYWSLPEASFTSNQAWLPVGLQTVP